MNAILGSSGLAEAIQATVVHHPLQDGRDVDSRADQGVDIARREQSNQPKGGGFNLLLASDFIDDLLPHPGHRVRGEVGIAEDPLRSGNDRMQRRVDVHQLHGDGVATLALSLMSETRHVDSVSERCVPGRSRKPSSKDPSDIVDREPDEADAIRPEVVGTDLEPPLLCRAGAKGRAVGLDVGQDPDLVRTG